MHLVLATAHGLRVYQIFHMALEAIVVRSHADTLFKTQCEFITKKNGCLNVNDMRALCSFVKYIFSESILQSWAHAHIIIGLAQMKEVKETQKKKKWMNAI